MSGIKFYVGVTDKDWYNILRRAQCDEVNFWKPGLTPFKALEPNGLFLFKLHSPDNYVVGGGFFVRYSLTPVQMAWDAFGIKNGTNSYGELLQRMEKYRKKNSLEEGNPQIGSIILTEPFFFDEEDWIPIPGREECSYFKQLVNELCQVEI